MPLYEYQCEACNHRFEVIQKFSDQPVSVCPVCGGSVKRLLSSPAIQFKGSGWYITDYARAGKTDGANAGAGKSEGEGKTAAKAGSDDGAASADSGKSDTAPAGTPPASTTKATD
jgi:putative FmdB family regulatory protein